MTVDADLRKYGEILQWSFIVIIHLVLMDSQEVPVLYNLCVNDFPALGLECRKSRGITPRSNLSMLLHGHPDWVLLHKLFQNRLGDCCLSIGSVCLCGK